MPPAIPLATYRIQFTSAFGFDAAVKYIPYLKRLGISHLYASPFLMARAGSTHGYDVIDYARLALHAPEIKYDLPAGGRRLDQGATGYDATIVSGRVTYRAGQATGALPGGLVRGKRAELAG